MFVSWYGLGETIRRPSNKGGMLSGQMNVVYPIFLYLFTLMLLWLWSDTILIELQVLSRGVGLSTRSDSELITQALCLNPPDGERDGPDWPARITHLMKLTPLSYSLVIMDKDRVFAVRDPYGNRPLCIGKILPVKTSKNTTGTQYYTGMSIRY